ncbi:MAG: NUDIX domain-containing protein [Betaproteobacteria bacterium]|nr:NUDIX domain-containing protein [Betaproteobacteria bacterium]
MSIAKALNTLDLIVPDPKLGLPDEMFHFISRTTPLVNVDLLIKDERNRTLLAWRNDAYCGRGWHIPGGIIRFKETFEERLKKVAELEIGTSVDVNLSPIAINELISQHTDVRGHFVSILFKCHLSGEFTPANAELTTDDPGYLEWHDTCPVNLISFHKMYEKFL